MRLHIRESCTERQSTCALEVDVFAPAILNRWSCDLWLINQLIHSHFSSTSNMLLKSFFTHGSGHWYCLSYPLPPSPALFFSGTQTWTTGSGWPSKPSISANMAGSALIFYCWGKQSWGGRRGDSCSLAVSDAPYLYGSFDYLSMTLSF